MVPMSDLRPGMKVKIVDHWVPGCCQNPDGLMDHWLGQIVTIRGVFDSFATIEEDTNDSRLGGWAWHPSAIDHIVTDDELFQDEEFSPAADPDFLSLLPIPAGGEVSYG